MTVPVDRSAPIIAGLKLPERRAIIKLHEQLDSSLSSIEALETENAKWERAEYTPGLTNIDLNGGGSGGSNNGFYRYIGGPDTGEYGILHVTGIIIFGTSGSILGSPACVDLPSVFTFDHSNSANHNYVSMAKYTTSGIGGSIGHMRYNGTNDAMQFVINDVSGTYPLLAAVTGTVPVTFASGSTIYYQAVIPVVRT